MFKNIIYKIRLKFIKKDYLYNIELRRNYLRKVINIIKIEDMLSDKTKYVKIDPFFNNIKEYNEFMTNTFLSYNFSKPIPKSLMNTYSKKIYHIDFYVDKNVMLDRKEELLYFITLYKELVDLIPYYNISDTGYSFLNFKILNYYLSNMEDVLIEIISSLLN